MGLAVLPPDPEDDNGLVEISDDDEDSDVSVHNEDERPFKRRRLSASSRQIALPGEIITDDTQWMR